MKVRGLWILVCLPLPLWIGAIGCNADGVNFEEEEEEVGETQQALGLGDIDCAETTSSDYSDQTGTCDVPDGDLCSYTTGTTNYGTDWSSGELCQEYLVVRANSPDAPAGGVDMNIEFFAAAWDPPVSTQAECEKLRVELAAYKQRTNDDWALIDTVTAEGEWVGGQCAYDMPTIDHDFNCFFGSCDRNPVVAARAYKTVTSGNPTILRVTAGFYRTDP